MVVVVTTIIVDTVVIGVATTIVVVVLLELEQVDCHSIVTGWYINGGWKGIDQCQDVDIAGLFGATSQMEG